MNDLLLTLPNLGALAVGFSLLWAVSYRIKNVSIVDIAWGPGFAAAAWFGALRLGLGFRPVLLAALVSLWGLRLGIHLAWRNLGHGEDYRYQEIRARNGPSFQYTSLVYVFWLQAALIWIVSLPLQLGIARNAADALGPLDAVAIAAFAVGFGFEAIGDAQLARFKKNPENRGRVLDSGLWRYTRHPNYFGDFVLWWGLGLLGVLSGAPLWTLLGPAVMSFFLLRVSGVTLLERTIHERRPAYREYQQRTSSFFPWPPRSTSQSESPQEVPDE